MAKLLFSIIIYIILFSFSLSAKTIFKNKFINVELIDLNTNQEIIRGNLVITFNIEYQITNKSNQDIKALDHKILGINDLFNDVLFNFNNLNLIKDVYIPSSSNKEFVQTFDIIVTSKDIISAKESLKRLRLIKLEDLIVNYQAKKLINNNNEIVYLEDLKLEVKRSSRKLTQIEIDNFLEQISSCWRLPIGAINMDENMYVKIFLEVNKSRKVIKESIQFVETNIPKSKKYYEPVVESAVTAFLNPECSELNLPIDKYQTWKNLTIKFDYSLF